MHSALIPLLSYGNLTQKEELDYIAYDQEVEGGFLVQIWNLTNGPLQYSDNPALEIYNYTSQCMSSLNQNVFF